MLDIEDPHQRLIAEQLGGLIDEVGSGIGDPHQRVALEYALHGGRGVELAPEPVAVVERGDVAPVEEHTAPGAFFARVFTEIGEPHANLPSLDTA